MTKPMQVVAYGGGTDSTAMILEMLQRSEPIDYITFADTGGERWYTYGYILMFNAYLIKNHGVGITVLKKDSMYSSLEDNCLKRNTLPSIAYGFKSCSEKYKIQPQDKFFNNLPAAREVWARGEKIIKCIGYDMDEERRAKPSPRPDKFTNRFPLIEWQIERERCIEIIQEHGLPLPGKSSCFFCPSSRKAEILELRDKYPALMTRALAMEANAELTTVKGLGRRFAWRDFLAGEVDDSGAPEQACGCIDG